MEPNPREYEKLVLLAKRYGMKTMPRMPYKHDPRRIPVFMETLNKVINQTTDMEVTLSSDKKSLIITLPFDEKGKLSESKKSMVHASTKGNKETTLEVNGKKLTIGVNAYTSAKD